MGKDVGQDGASTEPSRYSNSARAWWAVSVFVLCAVVSYTDRYVLSILIDPIKGNLGISETEVSLVQGFAFASVYALAGLPLGRLADRGHRVSLMAGGVIVWTAATVACGLAQNFSSLFSARLLVGAGEAALAPAAYSMIGDLFPGRGRGTALAIFTAGMTLGQGASLLVGGSLLQAATEGAFVGIPFVGDLAPWRTTFLALAPPGVIALMLLCTLREPPRIINAGSEEEPGDIREVLRSLYRRRGYVFPIWAALALGCAGDAAFSGWVPTLLTRVYHIQPAMAGATLGLVSILSGVAGTLVGGILGNIVDSGGGARNRIIAASVGAAIAAGTALVCLSSGLAAVTVYFAIWIFFNNLCQIAGISALQDMLPSRMRGINIALVAFFDIFFGSSIGTASVASLTQFVFRDPYAVGWSIAIVVGLSSILAAGLFAAASRALNQVREPSASELAPVAIGRI